MEFGSLDSGVFSTYRIYSNYGKLVQVKCIKIRYNLAAELWGIQRCHFLGLGVVSE